MPPGNIRSPEVFINLRVRGLGPSATLAINERSNQLLKEGREVLKLGLGQSPFPVPDHVRDALCNSAHEKDYLPVKGLLPLRESIVDWVKRSEHLHYKPENILIGPGTKELMFLAQLVYYGDLVIPSPSWVSYAPQAQIIGRPIQWLPTKIETGLGATPEAIEALCEQDPNRPRLMVLNSPGNPTGVAYSESQLIALSEVLRKYRVLVISDEIYSGTHFDGAHQSLARYYPEGTIISNGLSKWCGAGGWRLGWFVFPDSLSWLCNAMASVASETYTAISAPIQYAAVSALEDRPEMDSYLDRSRRILGTLSEYASSRYAQAGAQQTKARGGFYLFPCFNAQREHLAAKGIHTSDQLCERLLEEVGVACLPGTCFGRPAEELSLRVALVDFEGDAALDAAHSEPVDFAFLRRHCSRVVEAVDRMSGFINGGGLDDLAAGSSSSDG